MNPGVLRSCQGTVVMVSARSARSLAVKPAPTAKSATSMSSWCAIHRPLPDDVPLVGVRKETDERVGRSVSFVVDGDDYAILADPDSDRDWRNAVDQRVGDRLGRSEREVLALTEA